MYGRVVNFPSLCGIKKVPMTQDFSMLKLGQSPNNLEWIDTLFYEQLDFNHSGDLQRGYMEHNLELSQKKGKGVFISQWFNPQWLREGHSKAQSFIYSSCDLWMLLDPENALQERHRKMLARLRSACRQTLRSPKGVSAGHLHHLTHDYFSHHDSHPNMHIF